ncbi:hypothetical protein MTR_2g030010 [Medicago truncatula]|uniref:Uncharacterized protein n=1 Tax=Medicago truncatula TaxID=3880 RepID=G7IJV8_MEDTR|nr:hypothetical protein MTR_2g030010 [Medicago truncatula]
MDMDLVVKVLNGSCSVVPCPKVWNIQSVHDSVLSAMEPCVTIEDGKELIKSWPSSIVRS